MSDSYDLSAYELDDPTAIGPEELAERCGGRVLTVGGEAEYDFGLRPSRDEDTQEAYDRGILQEFNPNEEIILKGPVCDLYVYVRAATKGAGHPLNYQQAGSCVAGGYQNAAVHRAAVEHVTLAQAEVFEMPFCLAAYAMSRFKLGWNTEGDGSTGSTMALAAAEVGICRWSLPILPQPRILGPAFTYGREVELRFGAWRNVSPAIREACKPHPMHFTVVRTLDQAEAELRKLRPLTVAGNWGGRTTGLSYVTDSTGRRYLWNGERVATWHHQQSINAVCYVTINGRERRIWRWINQWYFVRNGVAVSVHGEVGHPDDPPGSYWTDDAALAHQLSYRFGEVRALKDFAGYSDGSLGVIGV